MKSSETLGDLVFTVQKAVQLTGLSQHTLRYYERVGLISSVRRDASSKHRQYSADDIARLEALSCMRSLGMPLADMKAYLSMAKQGRKACGQMLTILEKQSARLHDRLAETQRFIEYTDLKLAYWQALQNQNNRAAQEIGERLRKRLRLGRPRR